MDTHDTSRSRSSPIDINSESTKHPLRINSRRHNKVVRWKLLFIIIAFIIQLTLLIRCPLFLLRQFLPSKVIPQLCPESNATQGDIDEQYIFTTVIFSFLYIGRFFEALVVEVSIYNFLFVQTVVDIHEFRELCIRGLIRKKWIKIGFVFIAVVLLIFSLSVPAIGISLEIQNGESVNCNGYSYGYYMIFWILDIIRYMYDIGVRLFMLLATIAIGRIWAGTKGGNKLLPEELAKFVELDELNLHKESEEPQEPKEPETYSDYLQDRNVTNEDHRERTEDYIQKGRKVEVVSEIFQPWFILPWILLLVGSSLDTDDFLSPWMDGTSRKGFYDLSQISYMVFNFSQLLLLVVPYLCSKKMNIHHSNYLSQSREEQLDKHQTASRIALASMQKIEKDNRFAFTPRILGTHIVIDVDGPIYIIFLLLSIFFTVVDAFNN